MLNVKGSVIDKGFGSNPTLPNISVYVSDEKGKPIQPAKYTTTDDNGFFSFSVDNSVKFISARVNSENIITKPISSVLNFDFSNINSKVLDEVVIKAKKPPIKVVDEKNVNKGNIKKENLFLKYLPQGLLVLVSVLIVSRVIYVNRKK